MLLDTFFTWNDCDELCQLNAEHMGNSACNQIEQRPAGTSEMLNWPMLVL